MLHHRLLSARFLHPRRSNSQLFLTLYQCVGEDRLHKVHRDTLLNRVPLQCGALLATLLQH